MDRVASTPVRMVLAVLVTCLVSATALTFTYEATRGRIAEQEKVAEERALRAVLSSADSFEAMETSVLERALDVSGGVPVAGIWRAIGTDGGFAGFAIRCAPRGYGGPMQMVVGLDRDGKVSGVSIIKHNETPGLGTKIMTEPTFLQQFMGWDAFAIDVAARGYDAISGATKSAHAVRAGVVAAGRVYQQVLVGLGDTKGVTIDE